MVLFALSLLEGWSLIRCSQCAIVNVGCRIEMCNDALLTDDVLRVAGRGSSEVGKEGKARACLPHPALVQCS